MYSNFDKKTILPLTILLILVSLFIWFVRTGYRDTLIDVVTVESENGIYDLSQIDFTSSIAFLTGNVAHIEGALLTPSQLEDRKSELVASNPSDFNTGRTARVLAIMPNDFEYTTVVAGEYSRKVYINGVFEGQSGIPSLEAETFHPAFRILYMDSYAEENLLEIVIQGSNFVHRSSSSYSDIHIGHPDLISSYFNIISYTEALTIGILLCLCCVHFLLGILLKHKDTNLLFSLLCLVWSIRYGLTGTRVLYHLIPDLDWYTAFRLEYISLPLTGYCLMMLLYHQLPGLMNKKFAYALNMIFISIGIYFCFGDTVSMSNFLLVFYIFYTIIVAAIASMIVLYLLRRKHEKMLLIEEVIISIASFVFFTAAIYDAIYYQNPQLFAPYSSLTEVSMLIFAFMNMIALFCTTIRWVQKATEAERSTKIKTEELEKFVKLKSEFMSIIAHEVKTPLTVIRGGASETLEVLEDNDPDMYDIIRDDQELIIRAVTELNETIFDLLDVTAIESGRLPLEKAPEQLSSIVQATVKLYQNQIADANIEVIFNFSPHLPDIMVDRKRIQQVILNLLSNAVRYTQNGTITITLFKEHDSQMIEVKDTGAGMTQNVVNKLTKGFINNGPHGYRGGIGLYGCHQIIFAHGGNMKIESTEGIGTTVLVILKQ